MKLHSATAVLALAVGLAVSACGDGTETDSASTGEAVKTPPTTTTAQTAPASAVDLPALVPTPADAVESKGPDAIADNGIHLYFKVGAAPAAVVAAYKTALEGKGWALTSIVSSNGAGGGGAVYTGTHGDAYGVFDGGGYGDNTYLNVCAWPTKPAQPNCGRGE